MRWDAEALWQRVEPLLPGFTIEIVPHCGSTNTVLLERARAGQVQPALLVAEQQTAGRGRQGRIWHSEAGASLLMSLALPLAPRAASGWQGLSLAVGVAVADALEPGGTRIGLKWPNDLWLREPGQPLAGHGRKLAGILIETVAAGPQRVAVIGIGINVRPLAADAGHFGSGRACASELQPEATPPWVLATVLEPLVRALLRFEALGLAPFRDRFDRRDLLRGAPLATHGAVVCIGEGDGIAEDGALRVRLGSGEVQLLSSGDISVRVQGLAGASVPDPGAGGPVPAEPDAPADPKRDAPADGGRG